MRKTSFTIFVFFSIILFCSLGTWQIYRLQWKVDLINEDKANVNLVNPEDGISPGQACVFYSKDNLGYKVLGGGWII